MPELPEVETIRRQLAPSVEGKAIERFDVEDERWSAPLKPVEIANAVEGRQITALSRRGKYMIWELSGEVYMVIHLRMTGALLFNAVDAPHVRGTIYLNSGDQVEFNDPRRFGTVQLVIGVEQLEEFFSGRLGIEPFDPAFTPELLGDLLAGRKTPIKAALLDQTRIAGIGNIYADEALFRAGVHPLRESGRLTPEQIDLLCEGIVAALEAGIEAKGASIDDFRHVDGAKGTFQNDFLVHRREGEACPNCGTTIVKFRAAGRGTYACETCQTRPRTKRKAAR